MRKRVISALCALLCVTLFFAVLPMSAFAEGTYRIQMNYECEETSDYCIASGVPGDWSVGTIYNKYLALRFKDIRGVATDISEVEIIYGGSALDPNKTLTEVFGENRDVTVLAKMKEKCTHPSYRTVDAHSATCTEVGYKKAYKCSACGHYFVSMGGEEIGDESAYEAWKHDPNGGKTADALGHNMYQGNAGMPATCKSAGIKPYWGCSRNICSTYFEDAEGKHPIGKIEDLFVWGSEGGAGYLPQLDPGCHAESTVTITNEVPASCVRTGCKAYAYCKTCKTYSGDYTLANGVYTFDSTFDNLNAWKQGDGKIDKLTTHAKADVTPHDEVAATCDTDGLKHYFYCAACGAYAEEGGFNDTTQRFTFSYPISDFEAWAADSTSGGLIPATGHDYGDWQEYDNEQHKRICAVDDTHIEYADHTFGDPTVTVTADDGAEGEMEYTCTACGYKKVEKFSYKVIEGDGSKYILGSKKDVTITADGEFAKFTGIEIDGAAVDASNYDAESGSTIVTLGSSYLETLKVGKHTITYLYEDGSCSGTFYIEKKSAGSDDGSGTGDTANYLAAVNIFLLAAAVAIFLARRYDLLARLGKKEN